MNNIVIKGNKNNNDNNRKNNHQKRNTGRPNQVNILKLKNNKYTNFMISDIVKATRGFCCDLRAIFIICFNEGVFMCEKRLFVQSLQYFPFGIIIFFFLCVKKVICLMF